MHPVTPQIREEEEDEEVDWAWIMDQGAVEADEVEGRVKEQSVKERWEEWEVPIGGLFGNSCDGMDGEDWIF